MSLQYLLLLISVALAACTSTSVAANNDAVTDNFKELVAFAGITFQGSKAELASRYRYSSQIVSEQKLNRTLYQSILASPPQHIEITPSILDKDDGYKYAMTMLIGNEVVSVEESVINNQRVFPWLVKLSAQLVIFDIASSQLVASKSLPILSCTDTPHQYPTSEQIKQRVYNMLLDNGCGKGVGLVNLFTEALRNIPAPTKASLTQFAVSDVIVEPAALPFLPEEFKQNNLQVMKRYIAHMLTKAISDGQSVAIQPYTADMSVLTMQSRFSGGEQTYNLNLPKPFYKVNFRLRGFKKMAHDVKQHGASYYYAVFSNLSVVKDSVRGEQLLFSQPLKYASIEVEPASQNTVDEWENFDKKLQVLTVALSTSLHNKNSNFFKMQGFSRAQQREVLEQLEQVEGAYTACAL